MKSVVDRELFPKSHAHQFGFPSFRFCAQVARSLRLLHVGAPFRFVCTPSTFQRSYSALVASACASGHARDARDGRVMARIYAALGGARCYEHRRV